MTMDNTVDIATEARTLDIDLTKWSWRVPEDWHFSTVDDPGNTTGKPNASSFNGRVHKYADLSQALIWIRYRALRLITNSIMLRCLTTARVLEPSLTHLFSKADLLKKIIDSLATEMCASVPYFFATTSTPPIDTSASAANPPPHPHYTPGTSEPAGLGTPCLTTMHPAVSTNHVTAAILPKIAGLLAWPLTVAVSTEHIPDAQRDWLRAKLLQAAHALGDLVLEAVAKEGEFKF